ncbi:MAG: hypothetical protein ACFFCQ_12860 [Promethearchaeota archaeon]
MEYKNYEESRLDDQIELVNEVTKDWKLWGYPNKEGLIRTYSREGFTPETRHYLYEGDKLLGFVSSQVEPVQDGVQMGSLQYPFVRAGHEELTEKLMNKAISVLKEKGVKKVACRWRKHWGIVPKLVKKFGYTDETQINLTAEIDLTSYEPSSVNNPNLRSVDPVADREELIRVFRSETPETVPTEQIAQGIDGWKERNDQIIANVIVTEGSEILSHSMLLYNQQDKTRGFLTGISIYKKGNEHLISDVYNFLCAKAKKAGIKTLQHTIASQVTDADYKSLGLSFDPIYSYTLNLE